MFFVFFAVRAFAASAGASSFVCFFVVFLCLFVSFFFCAPPVHPPSVFLFSPGRPPLVVVNPSFICLVSCSPERAAAAIRRVRRRPSGRAARALDPLSSGASSAVQASRPQSRHFSHVAGYCTRASDLYRPLLGIHGLRRCPPARRCFSRTGESAPPPNARASLFRFLFRASSSWGRHDRRRARQHPVSLSASGHLPSKEEEASARARRGGTSGGRRPPSAARRPVTTRSLTRPRPPKTHPPPPTKQKTKKASTPTATARFAASPSPPWPSPSLPSPSTAGGCTS